MPLRARRCKCRRYGTTTHVGSCRSLWRSDASQPQIAPSQASPLRAGSELCRNGVHPGLGGWDLVLSDHIRTIFFASGTLEWPQMIANALYGFN